MTHRSKALVDGLERNSVLEGLEFAYFGGKKECNVAQVRRAG